MNIRLNSWQELKDVINKHYLKLMYDEFDTYYFLYCIKGELCWHYSLPKRDENKSNEQLDFEENYKILAKDWATKKESFLLTFNSNQTTEIDIKFKDANDNDIPIWLFSGGYNVIGNISGENDSLNLFVIDKDNILGYGENIILSNFIKNENIYSNKKFLFEDPYKEYDFIPAGLYIRIIYNNTGNTDAKIDIFFTYKYIETSS